MENILKPITEVILRENDNLAIVFPTAIGRTPRFSLYFFRVARKHFLHRTYNEELSELDSGETVELNFLGEDGIGTGDDILRVWRERPFRLLHYGIGIAPSEIWYYKGQPSDLFQTGWGYEITAKVGDKVDYVSGAMSPYEKPTIATESVLFHKLTHYFGLRNSAGRTIRPNLRFLGAGYDVLPITAESFVNKMLAGIKPVRYTTIGGLKDFSYTVPSEWEGNEVSLDKEKVERLMGGSPVRGVMR